MSADYYAVGDGPCAGCGELTCGREHDQWARGEPHHPIGGDPGRPWCHRCPLPIGPCDECGEPLELRMCNQDRPGWNTFPFTFHPGSQPCEAPYRLNEFDRAWQRGERRVEDFPGMRRGGQ